MKKSIVIIGTLDTKGEEVLYIKNKVEKEGFSPIVIDAGVLGNPFFSPHISREYIAIKGGVNLKELKTCNNKGLAIKTMAKGVRAVITELYCNGKINGVIALGGGQGTFIGTYSMRDLPLGFPKIMVTTIGSGNMRPFIGTKDIIIFNSVVDIFGMNFIFKIILENSVNALIGMVVGNHKIIKSSSIKIGATALGTTTTGLMKAKEIFKSKGYELIPFHANGIGGKAMEEMVEKGLIDAIFDWSTHEVTDEICKGIFSAGPHRLEILEKKAIPYLLIPGGIDYIVLESFFNKRNRRYIVHNDNIVLVRTNSQEMKKIALFFAEKLNKAKGPVTILIPLEGFSEEDKAGKDFYDPKIDNYFLKILKKYVNSNISIIEIKAHINDTYFVRECVSIFEKIIRDYLKQK